MYRITSYPQNENPFSPFGLTNGIEWINDGCMVESQQVPECLSDKIRRFDREIDELQGRLKLAQERRRMALELQREEEEAVSRNGQRIFAFQAPVDHSALPLKNLVLTVLSTTTPTLQDQIVREIETRVRTDGRSLKRSVNAVLMGLAHSGLVEKTGVKQWKRVRPRETQESDGGI